MKRRGGMWAAMMVLAVFALTGLGCTAPEHPVPIDQIAVPQGFDFSMTKDVTVKVTVADDTGKILPGSLVTVGNTEEQLVPGNILARGITNDQGLFERVIRVPAHYGALRVQALRSGEGQETDAAISNNEVFVAFGPAA